MNHLFGKTSNIFFLFQFFHRSGYMSEEYAMQNIFSDKSDVFSFGVLILEIITGQRNLDFCRSHPGDSLLSLVS